MYQKTSMYKFIIITLIVTCDTYLRYIYILCIYVYVLYSWYTAFVSALVNYNLHNSVTWDVETI